MPADTVSVWNGHLVEGLPWPRREELYPESSRTFHSVTTYFSFQKDEKGNVSKYCPCFYTVSN